MNGFGLDPTTKWHETVRDAQWLNITKPTEPGSPSPARKKWQTIAGVARRAGADDSDSNVSISGSSSSDDSTKHGNKNETRAEYERRKAAAKEKRRQTAKMMDLQYFLEMVDQKHRYGSSLRKYHAVWKSSDSDQNFFYWLDYGDGKDVELEECSRSRLDREQVRYLSREERLQYLVKIDAEGQLIWAKNGERVWTKDELYRDSVNGIVPTNDPAPAWSHNVKTDYHDSSSHSDSDSDAEEENATQTEKNKLEGERYVNEDFHRAKGPAKLKHVSAGVLFNHMLRQSVKKGHKWIFVADVSMHLYIGYKQSGSFQHSSFLHGSRILSAGLIKVKDGRLRRLSPLSGHYRPPAANFRAFVHSLEEEGCDMSHVSISRSYAVLVGLEGYVKTRRRFKKAEKAVEYQVEKAMHPDKVKAEEEAALDNSQSAKREREFLEAQRQDMSHKHDGEKGNDKFTKRLSNAWGRLTGKTVSLNNQTVSDARGVPGTGPEDSVPAPDGDRHLELKSDK